MASGGDIYSATGFKCTEQDVANFMEMVYSYWNKHQYPALRKQTTWKIQLLKPSQWFKHHSILVQSAETGEYFTIELFVYAGTGAQQARVIPRSRHSDPSTERHAHLEATDLGEVQSSAVNLFDTALRCLKEFGQYDQYTNNCQDYCQMLAGKLGCSTSFTDVQKTAAIGVAAVAGVGLTAWAVKTVIDWFSAEDDEDKDKKKNTR